MLDVRVQMCTLMRTLVILCSFWLSTEGSDFLFDDDLSVYNFKSVMKENPMLYFSPGDIPKFQAGIETTHKVLAKEVFAARDDILKEKLLPKTIKEVTQQQLLLWGNVLPSLAFSQVLKPDAATQKFLLTIMDQLAAYPTWTPASPNEEMPVSRLLIGFASSYDMVFPQLDAKRQAAYMTKITAQTRELYELSKQRWWGVKVSGNDHATTNFLGILTGAIISHQKTEDAVTWKEASVEQLQRIMQLLGLVVDGSHNEGVCYGTYTARAIVDFVFFAQRHLYADLTVHSWLQKHLDFYYYTMHPEMHRTVGIGDTGENWWYGPESQLHFLDKFVLQNGHANWLAKQIRQNRNIFWRSRRGRSNAYACLHTEYIWYDPNLQPVPVPGHDQAEMHTFPNWGVVTYRDDSILSRSFTFVSFKSSPVRGAAMYDLAQLTTSSQVMFNAAHEHPDQNSFSFIPDGALFVTDGHHGPKMTYMENTLMFGPSPSKDLSPCTYPWVGQLGDCGIWLTYNKSESYRSRGQLVAAGHKNGVFYSSGESVLAYSPKLGLESVYRQMVLLDKDFLIVVDSIKKSPKSKVKNVSAFFNNKLSRFTKNTCEYRCGAYTHLIPSTGDRKKFQYNIIWFAEDEASPKPTIQDIRSVGNQKLPNPVSNINVTFSLKKSHTRYIYVLYGPGVEIEHHNTKVDPKKPDRLLLDIKTKTERIKLNFNSDYRSVATKNTSEFLHIDRQNLPKPIKFSHESAIITKDDITKMFTKPKPTEKPAPKKPKSKDTQQHGKFPDYELTLSPRLQKIIDNTFKPSWRDDEPAFVKILAKVTLFQPVNLAALTILVTLFYFFRFILRRMANGLLWKVIKHWVDRKKSEQLPTQVQK